MISIAIVSQGLVAISVGYSGTLDFLLCIFVRWHTSHASTYFLMSLVMVGHQNSLPMSSCVRYCPGCPAIGLSWWAHITSKIILLLFGTKILFHFQTMPLGSLLQSCPLLSISNAFKRCCAIAIALIRSPLPPSRTARNRCSSNKVTVSLSFSP